MVEHIRQGQIVNDCCQEGRPQLQLQPDGTPGDMNPLLRGALL